MKKTQNLAFLLALFMLAIGILFYGFQTDSRKTDSQFSPDESTRPIRPISSLKDIPKLLDKAVAKDRPALISEGVKAARERTASLIQIAKTHPVRVLNAMMSLDELAALPPEVRDESEVPFSAIGSIDLRWATSINPDGTLNCTHRNLAIVDGRSWEIAGESFANPRQPLTNVPLNGYLVGDVLVLDESGVRELSAAEIDVSETFFPNADRNPTDPVTGREVDPSVAAVIGGQTYHFENQGIIDYVRETINNAEGAIDPSKSREVSHGLAWLPVAADNGSSGGQTVLASPFINDALKVLFIRADFADFPGAPVSQIDLQNSLTTVNTRIQNFSYSKASITFNVTNNVYRLPTNGATVATAPGSLGGIDTIISEARSLASADFNLANFDVVAVFFPDLSNIANSKITFGGLASVGGGNHWINGVPTQFQVEIILHEFGHNYGLNHANYQHPAKLIAGDYLDLAQSSLEYGDIYDRMGEGDEDSGYFSPYAMSRLEWMPPGKVITPTAGGTFTIHRFDHPAATSNTTLALKVPMGGNNFHWVGLRQLFPDTASRAYIVNEGLVLNTPNLVDATPGSATAGSPDRIDAALPVGSNFYDAAAGVRFTTMAAGGTEPNQFVDVKIDFDSRLELQSTNILVDEAAGNAALVVTRGFSTLGACSVSYSTAGVTATSGTDFHATSGTLNWADGDSTARTIYVPIRPDTIAEGSETFTLTLSSAVNAVLPPATNAATVTILDAGNRLTNFAPPFFNTTVSAIAPLPDGSVMAGGTMNLEIPGNIAKFDSDGSENIEFRTNKGTGFNGAVNNVLQQADGKIVVSGSFSTYKGGASPFLARINQDGSHDTAFSTALGTGPNNVVYALAQQADGNLLIGGDFSSINGTPATGIARISPTGSILSFSPVFTAGVTPLIRAIDIAPAPDDRIMIGGVFATGSGVGGVFKFSIARLQSNGSVDTSFNPGFGTHGSTTSTPAFVTSISRVRDNGALKYLIGGNFLSYNGTSRGSLALVNENGTLDTGFNPGTINGNVLKVFTDSSGRLIVGGSFTAPGNRIAALRTDGTIDTSLNLSGGLTSGFVQAFASDAAGDTYIGGNFFNFGGSSSRPLVKIAGGLDRFTLWKSGVFTPTQVAAGLTGSEEDFDGDGILNITEMALGLSPTVPDSPNSFAIAAGNLSIQSASSSEFLQATMQRSADNVGVWLVAQFSSDLTNWLPVTPFPGSNATYDVMESSSTRFTVRDKTPSASGVKRFVRFRAVLPN